MEKTRQLHLKNSEEKNKIINFNSLSRSQMFKLR